MPISPVSNNAPAWWEIDNHEKSLGSEPPQVQVISERYSGIRRKDGRSYGEPVNNKVVASGMHLFVYKPDNREPGKKPEDIWSAFSQWDQDNCVSVAAIKMAMMQFGEQPTDVFKEVREVPGGFQVTLRNNETAYVTQAELEMTAMAMKLKGTDPRAITSANVISTVMAKVEQQKLSKEQNRNVGFGEALQVLNRPDALPLALARLGLGSRIEMVPPEDLLNGRLGAFSSGVKNGSHSSVSVGGKEERWGQRGGPSPTGEDIYAYAFKKS